MASLGWGFSQDEQKVSPTYELLLGWLKTTGRFSRAREKCKDTCRLEPEYKR